MKKQDIEMLKNFFDNDYLLNDYIVFKKITNDKIKVIYNDKIITIAEGMGFAYLIGWWCDGSITGGQAKRINDMCRTYNDRF